jgi:hypothetical protein
MEMIARASLLSKTIPSPLEMRSEPLTERIKEMLDALFAPFNIKREDVQIDFKVESESDDDY